jgi:fatty acid desaturase
MFTLSIPVASDGLALLTPFQSNRFCFNDGYHTSHHLHPRRHWREHPVALLQDQKRYSDERALVFRNVDYLMLTVKLLQKDYMHLARCMVPIGPEQREMSLEQRADMLRSRTRRLPDAYLERHSLKKR